MPWIPATFWSLLVAALILFGLALRLKRPGLAFAGAMMALIPFLLIARGLAFIVLNQDLPSVGPTMSVHGPRRLSYRFDIASDGRLIGVVNQDAFAWNDVHVQIGAGTESFECPTLPTIETGQALHLNGVSCRSAGGLAPPRICVVTVIAQEGHMTSAFEPCVTVE